MDAVGVPFYTPEELKWDAVGVQIIIFSVINRFNLKDGRLQRPILKLQRFKSSTV